MLVAVQVALVEERWEVVYYEEPDGRLRVEKFGDEIVSQYLLKLGVVRRVAHDNALALL